MNRYIASIILILGISTILLTPLLFIVTFGHHEYGSPSDWANFATYFSGISTPILAFLSVIFLYYQLIIQKRATENSIQQLKETALINERNLNHQLSLKYLTELNEWLPAVVDEFENLTIKIPLDLDAKKSNLKPVLLTKLQDHMKIYGLSFEATAKLISTNGDITEVRRACVLAHRAIMISSSYLKLNGFSEHRCQQLTRIALCSMSLPPLCRALDLTDWAEKIDSAAEELLRLTEMAPETYYAKINSIVN